MNRFFTNAGTAVVCAVAMLGCAGTALQGTRADAPITVIAHLDIAPLQMSNVLVLMHDYIATVQHQPGAVHIEVLRQGNHPNHFTVIETWANAPAYEAHIASPAVRTFRAKVDPLLGSPHDERLFTVLGATPAA